MFLSFPVSYKHLDVYKRQVEGPDGLLFSAMEYDDEAGSNQENAALAAELGSDVNYTIWVRQTEGVTLLSLIHISRISLRMMS